MHGIQTKVADLTLDPPSVMRITFFRYVNLKVAVVWHCSTIWHAISSGFNIQLPAWNFAASIWCNLFAMLKCRADYANDAERGQSKPSSFAFETVLHCSQWRQCPHRYALYLVGYPFVYMSKLMPIIKRMGYEPQLQTFPLLVARRSQATILAWLKSWNPWTPERPLVLLRVSIKMANTQRPMKELRVKIWTLPRRKECCKHFSPIHDFCLTLYQGSHSSFSLANPSISVSIGSFNRDDILVRLEHQETPKSVLS